MKNEGGAGADIRDRALKFGQAAVSLHRRIYRAAPELRDTSRQMSRAGTAIGALLEEADAAHSGADFLSKPTTSLKEARECRYWLRILHREMREERPSIAKLGKESTEIIAILTTIVKNTRNRR